MLVLKYITYQLICETFYTLFDTKCVEFYIPLEEKFNSSLSFMYQIDIPSVAKSGVILEQLYFDSIRATLRFKMMENNNSLPSIAL